MKAAGVWSVDRRRWAGVPKGRNKHLTAGWVARLGEIDVGQYQPPLARSQAVADRITRQATEQRLIAVNDVVLRSDKSRKDRDRVAAAWHPPTMEKLRGLVTANRLNVDGEPRRAPCGYTATAV